MGAVFAPERLSVFQMDVVQGAQLHALTAADTGFRCPEGIGFYKEAIEHRVHRAAHKAVIEGLSLRRKFLPGSELGQHLPKRRLCLLHNALCLLFLGYIEHGNVVFRHDDLSSPHVLQLLLRRMADDGCDTCVMEVSSLGLKFDRAAEIEFAVGVFTNLSPDHIGPDEHADFAEYLFWKRALFRRCRVGVFNNDDPHVGKIMQGLSCRAVTYGIGCPADVRADADFALTRAGGRLGAAFTVDGARYAVGMPGAFSVYNALAALTAARVLGAGEDAIHAGLAGAVVCGRVEPVPLDAPFTVVIDYAHNEAAAECLLRTLRAYRPTRLVAVFGCGGARSRLRRFGMGSVCARLADFCIITEDNSRGEPVEHILADIRAGLRLGNPATPFAEIPDRRQAIYYALDHAQPGDIIAILGKGHETTIERGGIKEPFVEREIVEEYWGR